MEKTYFNISWELEKLYNDGYTSQQIEDELQIRLDSGKIKAWELIDALVDCKFKEMRQRKQLENVKKAFGY